MSSPAPLEQANNNSMSAGQQSPPFPAFVPHIDLDPSSPHPHGFPLPPQYPMQQPMFPGFNQTPPLQNMPVQYYPNPYASQQFYFPHPGQHPYCSQNAPPEYGMPSKPRRTRSKKKPAATGGSSRGTSYTQAEDIALCSAYLNVSRDPIVGTNQKNDTYWERIAKYYNSSNVPCSRSPLSLSNRWLIISKETSRFCSIKARVDRLKQSGKTEQDRVILHCFL